MEIQAGSFCQRPLECIDQLTRKTSTDIDEAITQVISEAVTPKKLVKEA